MGEGNQDERGRVQCECLAIQLPPRLAVGSGGDCHWNTQEQRTREASASTVWSGASSEELEPEEHQNTERTTCATQDLSVFSTPWNSYKRTDLYKTICA